MNKLTAGFLAAALGGAMLVSGGAAQATVTHTDLRASIDDISPDPVIVTKTGTTTVTIDVVTDDSAESVELQVRPIGDTLKSTPSIVKPVEHDNHWIFTVPFTGEDFLGKWLATATASDGHGKTVVDTDKFLVKAAQTKADTRITRFSASPDPVRKGKTIWLKGRLQVNDEGWGGLEDAPVSVYFRASNSNVWKWVAKGTTNYRGYFTTSTKAVRSGTFRASYSGSADTNSSQSSTDWVRVYRWNR